jgi:hypothetical protein
MNDYLPEMIMKIDEEPEAAKPDIFDELNKTNVQLNPEYQ